jgi:membrane protease YdiL (CAAX protease family)
MRRRMNKLSSSLKIYFALIILLAVFSAISVFMSQGLLKMMPEDDFPAPLPLMALINFFTMVILYGGLGFIGINCSSKMGFPDLWDNKISNKNKILFPAFTGIIIGILFIVVDSIFTKLFSLPSQIHPEFPFSIITSFTAGVGEEIIFRLFLISFLVWLISKKILKNKYENIVFLVITILTSISFAMGHIPSVMILMGYETFTEIPLGLIIEMILLNGLVSVFCAINFKKHGIISAMGIHFWTDIIWHVIWGLIV